MHTGQPSLRSCSAPIEGAESVIGITTYPSSDEDIYAAENRYAVLESALNQQINEMERRHPNYDEYQYNIAENGHNPYIVLDMTREYIIYRLRRMGIISSGSFLIFLEN